MIEEDEFSDYFASSQSVHKQQSRYSESITPGPAVLVKNSLESCDIVFQLF